MTYSKLESSDFIWDMDVDGLVKIKESFILIELIGLY